MTDACAPADVLAQVAAAVPAPMRQHMLIIGSLAAGYALFGSDSARAVRTKDVDCVLVPYREAVGAAQEITEALLAAGWRPRTAGDHTAPGDANTPDDQLPAIRLYPPSTSEHSAAWFLELLTEPESEDTDGKRWSRVILRNGHFGLPSFRFLRLLAQHAEFATTLGVQYARPELMALANLLEHPTIKPAVVQGMRTDVGEPLKRSNKDLGRVLALALLASANGLPDFRMWNAMWADALARAFPRTWRPPAAQAGSGLRALLESPRDFAQAFWSCRTGLLATVGAESSELRTVAARLLDEAIKPLETQARAT